MSKRDFTIVSVGGSIIIPQTGFDTGFLKDFKKTILGEVKKGKRFILVIGGGATARTYQRGAQEAADMSDEALDWIGIHTTRLNAQFVRFLFDDHACKRVIEDPTKRHRTNKPVIIASGWKPGRSTDAVAVELAKSHGAERVINLSNIKYVYDKDPKKYKNVKKIENMNWEQFRTDVVSSKWHPGSSAPFDTVASKVAEKLRLTVSILDGKNLKEVRKAIRGEKFQGTVIHP